ncbi:MAG: GNAT family N-acetyltransferase [Gemmatimonadales bacterium]
MSRTVDVVVSYLAMTSPAQLRPGAVPHEEFRVVQLDSSSEGTPTIVRQLYLDVGAAWHWQDRAKWSDQEWADAIRKEGVEIWVALRDRDVAQVGYYELERSDGDVDIRYFGLLAGFIGRGLGGWLLTKAVERAWEQGAARVTLNTCSLDGAAALPNYRSRGFELVRIVHQRRELPDEPR